METQRLLLLNFQSGGKIKLAKRSISLVRVKEENDIDSIGEVSIVDFQSISRNFRQGLFGESEESDVCR